jgi:hypothetical protein
MRCIAWVQAIAGRHTCDAGMPHDARAWSTRMRRGVRA